MTLEGCDFVRIRVHEHGISGDIVIENGLSQGQHSHMKIDGKCPSSQHMPTESPHTIKPIISSKINNKQSKSLYHTGEKSVCKRVTISNKNSNFNHKGEKPALLSPSTDNSNKISITMETYNCHGFSRTADYVLERLNNSDIMGLTETWLRSNELHTVKDALQNHSKF